MVNASRRKLGRADWLAAALVALEEGGLGAVKVLSLAKRLKASRGSFYWHFKDRDDLLRSVLDYWDTEITDAVIERSLLGVEEPRESLKSLTYEVIGERRGRFDPAIRAWAVHDRQAAAVVERVDRKRLAYLKSLFQGLGFDAEAAEARSRLTLAYFIGDHVILEKEPAAKRRKLMRLRFEILTADDN